MEVRPGIRTGPGLVPYYHLTNRLNYLGQTMHQLDGAHGKRVLDEWCEKWNHEDYTPTRPGPKCAGDYGPVRRRRVMADTRY